MAPLIYFVGQRVRHAEFGEGTVRYVGADGVLLRVLFDAIGSVAAVQASTLVDLAAPGGSARPQAEKSTDRTPVATVPRDLHRLTVECQRQGLPPPGELKHWTFGNIKARESIDAAIATAAHGTGSVLYTCAGYGQGKSHLGGLGRELARSRGLASFHVELDGAGLSLGTGSRVVASLFASARLPDTGHDQEHLVPGLATILKRAAPAAVHGVPRQLTDFEPFLKNPSRWGESDEIIEVLEEYLSGYRNRDDSSADLRRLLGVPVPLQSLKLDWGRIDDRFRKRAQQLERIVRLAMMAGAKGAFVVIDELDHDFQSLDGRKIAMLQALYRITASSPIVLLLLAREFEIPGFPISTDEILMSLALSIGLPAPTNLELEDLREEDLRLLVNKAIDAFAAAFPSPALAHGRDEFFNILLRKFRQEYEGIGWGPRFFVRATVESCEATRSRRLESLAHVEI